MKLYDSVELAAHNLRESVLRNSLTTIGIAVGVASLVAMLSLGIGLQRMASRRLKTSGLFDTVVVTSRRDLRSFNSLNMQRGDYFWNHHRYHHRDWDRDHGLWRGQ